jgi:uncharacterized repeat protein (TIGR01451 family)
VTPPLGVTDPVPGNNAATDTNVADPQADLTSARRARPTRTCRERSSRTRCGDQCRPSNVTVRARAGRLPAALAGFGWTCTRDGAGASCATTRGQRQHRCAGDAAGGTSATFVVSGTLPRGTSGALTQHGDGDATTGVTDPVPGTTQTDTNPGGAAGGLPSASAQSQSVRAGRSLTYTVSVSNAGPSNVSNARVQDALPRRWRVRLDLRAERRRVRRAARRRGWQHRRAADAAVGTSCDVHGERDGAGGNDRALVNTATVTPPRGDRSGAGNNEGTDTNPRGRRRTEHQQERAHEPYVPGRW